MTETKKTILYIEDDPASLRLIERMLTHAGYEVLPAECGLDGIDLARKKRPDLILTDLKLPDITGYEIATTLRGDAHFKETPIVALTSHLADGAHHDMAIAAGITGYLTKPINIAELLNQLSYYLAGGHDEIDDERLFAAQARYTREVVARLEGRIRELEAGNAALRKLDDIKQTFIQITAHELRTPLTLVVGYSRLLKDHELLRELVARDENIHSLIDGLVEAINRMHVTIDEIMITSRILAGKMNPSLTFTDLGQLVQQSIRHHNKALIERNLTAHFTPEDWPKRVVSDTEMLRIVLNNLISNAIKYTPDGGNIYLEARTTQDQVEFSVRDTGIGIALEDQGRVFEQFGTLSDFELHSTSKTAFRGGGLGLGLPVCKGVIKAHGGTISVESQGHDPESCPGSRFIVTLPLGDINNLDSENSLWG
jgi:signal transduction histidine kinase